MPSFSEKTNWPLSPNPLSREVKKILASGRSFTDLTVSNPTQCGFEYLQEEILKPFTHSENLTYDPAPNGLARAREAVVEYYAQKKIIAGPNQIFITASTSEAYSFVFKLLANPGDTILVPQPSYPILDYLITLHDLRGQKYSLPAPSWKPDFREIADLCRQTSPKAVLAVHPNNPTGTYFPAEAVRELRLPGSPAWIADEVFFDFRTRSAPPIASFAAESGSLCFTLSGISKVLGLPQMKLSWIMMTGPSKRVREACQRMEVISDTYLSVNTPAQNALSFWMKCRKGIQREIMNRIEENIRQAVRLFSESKGLTLYPPAGGWSLVIRLPEGIKDEETALQLVKEDGVLVHPGYLFDFPDDRHLVVSLLTPPRLFAQGLQKIQQQILRLV